jgi:hypothetical protein
MMMMMMMMHAWQLGSLCCSDRKMNGVAGFDQ